VPKTAKVEQRCIFKIQVLGSVTCIFEVGSSSSSSSSKEAAAAMKQQNYIYVVAMTNITMTMIIKGKNRNI
jgi:hypothetical protein